MDYTLIDIAIVILNWNGKTLLEKFIPILINNSGKAKIYIADNGSTDNSEIYISQNYPKITFLKLNKNYGFAGGYNKAIEQVSERLICILNNDVSVGSNWLSPIIEQFNSNEKCDIVQPKILDFINKEFFEYAGAAGGFIDKYAMPYCRGRIFDTLEKDEGQYNDIIPIHWASGACMFIKRSVFVSLKGFDTYFFAHMEEIDLCWRALNLNYNIYYNGASTVYHVGGATLQSTHPKKTFLNFRNSLFMLVKNSPTPLLLTITTRLFLDGLAGIYFLIKAKPKHTLAVLQAHFAFYTQLIVYLKKRNYGPKRKNYFNVKSIVYQYYFLKRKKY